MSKNPSSSLESTDSFDAKQNKRKLMPLRVKNVALFDETNQIEYNPIERLKPVCPYLETTPSKPNASASSKRKQTEENDENAAENQDPNLSAEGQSLQSPPNRSEFQESSLKESENKSNASSINKITDMKKTKVSVMPSKTRTMVCTYMHSKDVDLVADAIERLGGFDLEPQVTRTTSHVVCGDEKRTVNLLRGIAYGCWILNYEWVKCSIDAGKWIAEEPFELKKFPSVHQCRVARETFGHKNDVFNGELIYVAQKTSPPHCDLVELLQLCSGIVVSSASKASVIVSPFKLKTVPRGTIQVNEKWVLDSIQENMMQSKVEYSFDTAS